MGLYVFETICCGFFLSLSSTKLPISIHFPSDHLHQNLLIKIYVVFNKLDTGYVCIIEGMHEENITKSILFGCWEPDKEMDFLTIFIFFFNILKI